MNRLVIPTGSPSMELRQLTLEDAPEYFNAVDANRVHLGQFGDTTANKYPSLDSVERSLLRPEDPDKIRFGIWNENTFAGSINLTPTEKGDAAEIGYWLDARHTGHGYATIATKALSSYAVSRFPRVFANVVEGNEASGRVLTRSGFLEVARENEVNIYEYSKIEAANLADLDGIIGFLEIAYADTYPNKRGITRSMFEGNKAFHDELRTYLEEQLANPSTLFLIAKQDGQVNGTVGIRDTKEDASVMELWGFYVDRKLHGTGLARELFDAAMQSDQVTTAQKTRLDVAKDAKRARAFYEKNGFTITGEEDWDWPNWTKERPHNQYWVMEKPLHNNL